MTGRMMVWRRGVMRVRAAVMIVMDGSMCVVTMRMELGRRRGPRAQLSGAVRRTDCGGH